MHFSTALTALFAVATTALALPASSEANTGACSHNNDAGRWDDSLSPADRLQQMCNDGTQCYQANIGRMCVVGDRGQCQTAVQAAVDWQSWHGNWWLWTVVQCGSLSVTIN